MNWCPFDFYFETIETSALFPHLTGVKLFEHVSSFISVWEPGFYCFLKITCNEFPFNKPKLEDILKAADLSS